MRRAFIVLLAVGLAIGAVVARPRPAAAQKRQKVRLPEGTVLDPRTRPAMSQDGSVGFVTPAEGDTLVAFAVRTGEVLDRLQGYGAGRGLAINEDGGRRLLTLAVAGDVVTRTQAAILVVDATEPGALSVVSFFRLPDGFELTPASRAEIARGQRFGVVPIAAPVGALISFDVATGQQVGAITLDGSPDRVSVTESGADARVAVLSASEGKVAVVSLADNGVLLPLASFTAPQDARLSTENNVAFDAAGRVGYVASLRGHVLMSFSLETGNLLDRLDTQGSPAAVAVYHKADHDVIAVVNISRPTGAAGDASPTPDEPLGLPGAVVVHADAEGKLAEQARFSPETGEETIAGNNPDFSADGRTIYVPVRTGSLYSVDAKTGKAIGREPIENRVHSIAAAPLAEAVAVVSAGPSAGEIDIVPAPSSLPDEPSDAGANDATKPGDKDANRTADAPVIERLSPNGVQAGHRRDLQVTVIGVGFAEGAAAVVGENRYPTVVSKNSRRANFTLPAALVDAPGSVSVKISNPDGSVSNEVALAVTPADTPVVTSVSPNAIHSGAGGVDVKVEGDRFRDGAVVRVAYVDDAGQSQLVALKTYRLGFKHVVAHLPARLTVQAEDFTLTVLDRDGATTSEPTDLKVVGPSIDGVRPERIVAGKLAASDVLSLSIDGSNLHRDARVYVKRPKRGGTDDTAQFRLVPFASVKWKSGKRIVVKLTARDVAYSGDMTVRVVNPIPSQRKRDGDAAEFKLTIAGPVITKVLPESILAGDDTVALVLEGTDFRNGAAVRLTRADENGDVRRRALLEDPNVKDHTRIRIPLDSADLMRFVAKPGTITVYVLNPSLGKSDVSSAQTISVFGPTIASYELKPVPGDDGAYRLVLTGEHFAQNSLAQLLLADGTEVGRMQETTFKSDTKLAFTISKAKLTSLGAFKVIVVNNVGSSIAPDGVASNAVDVTFTN